MRLAHRSWLPFAAAALAVLTLLPSFAKPVDAATTYWTSKCEVRVRNAPRMSATTLKIIPKGAVVKATSIVSGGSYRADCGGSVSGSSWLRVVAINGKSTTSLVGRSAVYVAKQLFKSGPTPVTTTTTNYISNCGVRLRSSASTSAGTKAIIDANEVVTASGKVTGSSWTADCPSSVSGTSWYKITAVGGKSVSSLYGVSAVYAATGLFRTVSSTSTTGFKEGIDVSHWQGAIDWARVRAAGKTFAVIKATEGVNFLDDKYAQNKAGAMAQGMKVGAYHFARPGNDPVREADWFVDHMGLQHGMLIPALDIEVTGGLGPTALTTWTKAFLARVTQRTGAKPMIYTSPAFWRNNLNDSRWFADNGYSVLWVAHWQTTSPSVPASNWGGKSWTFWQYSSEGSVPGISGRVDLDRYRLSSWDSVTY